jgi:hypothetical protein
MQAIKKERALILVFTNSNSSSNVVCQTATTDPFPTTDITLAAAAAALSKEQCNKWNNSSKLNTKVLDSTRALSLVLVLCL